MAKLRKLLKKCEYFDPPISASECSRPAKNGDRSEWKLDWESNGTNGLPIDRGNALMPKNPYNVLASSLPP